MRQRSGSLTDRERDRKRFQEGDLRTRRERFDRDLSDSLNQDQAQNLVHEALKLYELRRDRVLSAERRAISLLQAVVIAATLNAAAGGFLLDPKLGSGWREGFAAILALILISFVLSGWRAALAIGALKQFERPKEDEIVKRAR